MMQVSSYREVIGQGEHAIVVHHRPIKGQIINLELDMENRVGHSGNWETPPGDTEKIILFKKEKDGHDVFVARLVEARKGAAAEKKWVYYFSDLELVGKSHVSWQQFVGKAERHGSTRVNHEPLEQEKKIVVLKPLKWNALNYVRPDGSRVSGGFPEDWGYGFEEWINSPSSVVNGWRYFHATTDQESALYEYGEEGALAMVFIASYKGDQFALGMAINVFSTSKAEQKLVGDLPGFVNRHEEAWRLPEVREKYKENKPAFSRHWKENRNCYNWKCPDSCFVWFEKPLKLKPEDISGQKRLISMFRMHQVIHPQQAVDILNKAGAMGASLEPWLRSGDFELPKLKEDVAKKLNKKMDASRKSAGGNSSPDNPYFRLLVGRSQQIDPLHTLLQSAFVNFLNGLRNVSDVVEDDQYTDVIFLDRGRQWLAEIKPTERVETRYAIRAAVGQLLEYRWRRGVDASLIIVLSSRPSDPEIAFANSLGIAVAWQLAGGFRVVFAEGFPTF